MVKDGKLICNKCGNLLITVNIVEIDPQSQKVKKQIVVPKGGLNMYIDKENKNNIYANCSKCGSATFFERSFLGV